MGYPAFCKSLGKVARGDTFLLVGDDESVMRDIESQLISLWRGAGAVMVTRIQGGDRSASAIEAVLDQPDLLGDLQVVVLEHVDKIDGVQGRAIRMFAKTSGVKIVASTQERDQELEQRGRFDHVVKARLSADTQEFRHWCRWVADQEGRGLSSEVLDLLQHEFMGRAIQARSDILKMAWTAPQAPQAPQDPKTADASGQHDVQVAGAIPCLTGIRQEQVFALTEALVLRRGPVALALIRDIRDQGQGVSRVLGLMASDLAFIRTTKDGLDRASWGGDRFPSYVRKNKIPAWKVDRLALLIKTMTRESLDAAFMALARVDYERRAKGLPDEQVLIRLYGSFLGV